MKLFWVLYYDQLVGETKINGTNSFAIFVKAKLFGIKIIYVQMEWGMKNMLRWLFYALNWFYRTKAVIKISSSVCKIIFLVLRLKDV